MLFKTPPIYKDDNNAFYGNVLSPRVSARYLSSENKSLISFQRQFSLEIEFNQYSINIAAAIFCLNLQGATSSNNRLMFRLFSGAVQISYLNSSSALVSQTIAAYSYLTKYKLVVSIDFDTLTLLWRLNSSTGSLVLSNDLSTIPLALEAINIGFGNGDNNQRGFLGWIRNVRIFNRVLSASEINQVHAEGNWVDKNALDSAIKDSILYEWRLNQRNGRIGLDTGPYKSHAKIRNYAGIDMIPNGNAWQPI